MLFERAPLPYSNFVPQAVSMSDETRQRNVDAHIALIAAAGENDLAEHGKRRKQQTLAARATKARKGLESKLLKERSISDKFRTDVALARELVANSRQVLQVPGNVSDQSTLKFVRMWAMQRLACSPRQSGASGVRQNQAAELVANAALDYQRRAFESSCRRAAAHRATLPAPGSTQVEVSNANTGYMFLGCRLMWDEASQTMRPLLNLGDSVMDSKAAALGAQTKIQCMTLACSLFAVATSVDDVGNWVSATRWEPWLTPLRLMAHVTSNRILEALLSSMPFNMDLPSSRKFVESACDAVLVALICDSAASNLKALRYLYYCAKVGGERWLIHAEVCFVHQLHICKTNVLDMVGLAGILYSFSKMVRLNSTLSAFRSGLLSSLAAKLQARRGKAPKRMVAFDTVTSILYQVDGHDDYMFKVLPDGTREPTQFYKTLKDVSEIAFFLPSGEIYVYLEDAPAHASARELKRIAMDLLWPRVEWLFVLHAWPEAALSRWTHVPQALRTNAVRHDHGPNST